MELKADKPRTQQGSGAVWRGQAAQASAGKQNTNYNDRLIHGAEPYVLRLQKPLNLGMKMADVKRLLALVGGIGVVAAGGWFAWQHFTAEAETAPAVVAKPRNAGSPAGTANNDVLIGDVLAASGFTDQMQRLPEQIQAGFREGLKQRSLPGNAATEVEKALSTAFSPKKFESRVQAQLKKNFDAAKLQSVLADVNKPAAQKMILLEKAAPDPEQLVAFAQAMQSNPLTETRMALVSRLESATKAGELSTEIMLSSLRSMAQGAAGDKAGDLAALDKVIETQRAAAAEPMRNAAILNYAFTYRKASDADLGEYVKIYETEHGKWFSAQIQAALIDEFRAASSDFGKQLAALAKGGGSTLAAAPQGETQQAASGTPAVPAVTSATPAPVIAAPAAPSAATPSDSARVAAVQTEKPSAPSRRRQDARSCLDKEANDAIIKCAEAFR